MTLVDYLATPWATWGLLSPLLLVAVVDWRTHTVPRPVTIGLLVLGSARAIAVGNWPGLVALLIASLDVRLSATNGAWDTIAHGLLLSWAGIWAQLQGRPEYALLAFVSIFTYHFWRLNWLGGGDGMLLIGLLAWNPTLLLLLCLVGGWVSAGVGMAAWYGRLPALYLPQAPATAVARATLEREGVPVAWGFAVGWLAWLVLTALGLG